MHIDWWIVLCILYFLAIIITLLPVFWYQFNHLRQSFPDEYFKSSKYDFEKKIILKEHYRDMQRTLGWYNRAKEYAWAHYYCLNWSLISAFFATVITQHIQPENFYSKLLLSMVVIHGGLCITFHQKLNIDGKYRCFSEASLEYYRLLRKIVYRPQDFGNTIEEQISKYFAETESIREYIRRVELDLIPNISKSEQYPK